MLSNSKQLLLLWGILVLMAFILNNSHDATVSIMITLEALNSLKER